MVMVLGRDLGGRPRLGGAAGESSVSEMAAFSRSTEIESSRSPILRRKILEPRSKTRYGP